MTGWIYLDYNATTPPAPEVLEAMIPALREAWGNPSSTHGPGQRARSLVEEARRRVASLLGCAPDEIVFTSGGTESDNAALVGVAEARSRDGRHLVTTAIEHPAIDQACRYLEGRGWTVTRVAPGRDGCVDPSAVEAALRPDTVLVSVMHANNETGVLQPVREIAHLARPRGIIVHTDAAQSVGKIAVRVDDLGVDLLTVAGHKLYAPKGVGALYLRRGTPFAGFLRGAAHESGRRAGTESTAEIVGLGVACDLAEREMGERASRLGALRDRLETRLRQRIPDLVVHGAGADRLPNTSSVAIPGADANTLLAGLDSVAASAGAACHAGGTEPSHVLTAMGIEPDLALSTLRLTVGRPTTEEEVDAAVDRIALLAEELRGEEPGGGDRSRAEEVRLTRMTHGLGCACKIRPFSLEAVLREIDLPTDSRVVVGHSTSDDACVWRLDDGSLMVATVDFFTPVLDDPYDFGRAAAANALSDVYAMGGRPWFALNLASFPVGRLPLVVLERILQGGADVCRAAGCAVVGGHTVEDPEPKYGLCVVGGIPDGDPWTNAGARPGDVLILTKAVGSGVVATAAKRGTASEAVRTALRDAIVMLNGPAAEAARRAGGVHACTDVTGFGLLGHLAEMTAASGADAEVHASLVPLLPGARDAVGAGAVPGGTLGNRRHLEERDRVRWDRGVDEVTAVLLCDAQTSGGLLLSVAPDHAEAIEASLDAAGVAGVARIGRIVGPGPGRIRVLP